MLSIMVSGHLFIHHFPHFPALISTFRPYSHYEPASYMRIWRLHCSPTLVCFTMSSQRLPNLSLIRGCRQGRPESPLLLLYSGCVSLSLSLSLNPAVSLSLCQSVLVLLLSPSVIKHYCCVLLTPENTAELEERQQDFKNNPS